MSKPNILLGNWFELAELVARQATELEILRNYIKILEEKNGVPPLFSDNQAQDPAPGLRGLPGILNN